MSSSARYQLTLDLEQFLAEYWQKKPLLIRQGFAQFVDPIDADDLAGLAQEEEVDSRIVSHTDKTNWQVRHGPFDDFSQLTETDWSLLVQAVDHWIPDSATLLNAFRFIPSWRIDDLMVSFSMPGGGVGPHLDQYDVFIIQGQGKRHWRVGEHQPTQAHCPHPDLLQVKPFKAIIDAELLPGDILYIPPGCPHEGYAIEPSLNYSVGFRAPSQRDLFNGLADYMVDNELGEQRFSDAGRQALFSHHGELSTADMQTLKASMRALLEDDALLYPFLLAQLSTPNRTVAIDTPEPALASEDVASLLAEGHSLTWHSGVKALYCNKPALFQPGELYINGERFDSKLSVNDKQILADNLQFDAERLALTDNSSLFTEVLTTLVNQGLLFEE
ncbi:cupin domain-containing protein [Corallincola holothuriorum]|uniref:Cupin domain-containing protein n=1 Tax=Corallincola holothuriorum TaxID=2282215 RepID=A0A368NRG8_9GAMM|nr:cupin domain-containing protein [Corallincola holothuriorum]RCU52415.1 cupin domain-containing protein [Corallincola holothuriorum]